MNRVVLINKIKSPTREELTTTEVEVGRTVLSPFGVREAGYMILPNQGKKAAMWLVDEGSMAALEQFIRLGTMQDYELALYRNGTNHMGGQCEVRVV